MFTPLLLGAYRGNDLNSLSPVSDDDPRYEWSNLRLKVVEIQVSESSFRCANLHNFNQFEGLESLSLRGCQIKWLGACDGSEVVPRPTPKLSFNLKSIDVSRNNIAKILQAHWITFELGSYSHVFSVLR